jgi:hypothetical protein
MVLPTDDQVIKDSYEYELMKLMEEERQLLATQVYISYKLYPKIFRISSNNNLNMNYIQISNDMLCR